MFARANQIDKDDSKLVVKALIILHNFLRNNTIEGDGMLKFINLLFLR